MTLRQEYAQDRSIHRKVKILLSLRKECTLPAIPFDQEDDLEMETITKTLGIDIPSGTLATEEA
jgi:hypothetical protein